MKRRSFLGSALAFIAGMFGAGKAKSVEAPVIGPWQENEATVPWLIKRLWEDVQKPFNAGVNITSYHCGNGNCSAPKCYYEGFSDTSSTRNGADDEGFAVIVTTPKHQYRISVKADYLGCTLSNNYPDPVVPTPWKRGYDLADGKRTVETWHLIVEDIRRMEETGSKYKATGRTTRCGQGWGWGTASPGTKGTG
jgi:hypothetical protein